MTSPFEALRLAKATKPPKVIVLPETAFKAPRPPSLATVVGLRLLSEAELQLARSEAARYVERAYTKDDDTGLTDFDAANEAWSDTLIALAVAAATTDPNDAAEPWLDAAPDRIQHTLTSQGIRFLWDALDELHIALAPIAPMVDDAELGAALASLSPEALAVLPEERALRVRRLLAAAVEAAK